MPNMIAYVLRIFNNFELIMGITIFSNIHFLILNNLDICSYD